MRERERDIWMREREREGAERRSREIIIIIDFCVSTTRRHSIVTESERERERCGNRARQM